MILWPHVHNSSTGPTGPALGLSFESHYHNTSHGPTTLPVVLPLGDGLLWHTHNASIYRLVAVARQIVEVFVGSGDGATGHDRRPPARPVSVFVPIRMSLLIELGETRARASARAFVTTVRVQASLSAKATAYQGFPDDDAVAAALLLLNRCA